MVELTNVKIEISKEKVLKRLGAKKKVDSRIKKIVEKEIENVYSLLDVYCVYKELDIEFVKGDEIKLKDGFTMKSKNQGRILENAKKGTLIAVTIGDEIEEKTGDLTVDVIRDAIGSEGVEELAVQLNKIITNKAKLGGYKTLFRFAVGYGGWDILK